eukprot:s325_g4.t1
MNGDRDHQAICLEMQMTFQSCFDDGRMGRVGLYDRSAARDNKHCRRIDLVEDLPPQAWEVDVNQHWNTFRNHLQQKSKTLFPKAKRQQRQSYFDRLTWQSLCDRKDLRLQHRALHRDINAFYLRACFGLWKQRCEGSAHTYRFELHQLRLHEAVVIEARRKLDQNFRTNKKRAWKQWVESKLSHNVATLNHSKAANLYQVLQPKKAIAKAKGHFLRPLPGLQDGEGQWHSDRRGVAMAWQAQFSQVENAEIVQFTDLMKKSVPNSAPRTVQDLLSVPTVFDLEKAIRTMQDRKSPGVDSLGAELYQINPASMAVRLYPLFLKTALRCQGVTEMAGGWLLALFKGKGNPNSMTSHRGIMLEAVAARIFSRAWRVPLVRGLEYMACPMQFGGRSGLSIEALHLHVKMAMQNAVLQKQSHALLFIDIRSAFYSIAKPLLAGSHGDVSKIRHIFEVMQLPDAVWEQFLHNVKSADLVRHATNSHLIAEGIASNLDQTWFAVPDGIHTCAPLTGSRPGDPMADVLFAMVMSRILSIVNQRAEQQGIHLLQATEQGTVSRTVTWVDDLAVSIQADPEHLVSKTTHVASIIQECMLEHGLSLSYGAGKSAVMLMFHGKRSTKARQHFEQNFKSGVPVCTEYQGVVTLPVVSHYKHLGGHLTRTRSILPEVKVRAARTMAQLQPLRRILTCEELPVERRCELMRVMGLSVLTLHTGTWWRMTKAEINAWHASVFKVYQTLHKRGPDGEVKHQDYFTLAEAAQCPLPMEMLYLQRLKLLFHVLKIGDSHMVAAILHNAAQAAEASWLHAALQSLKWLQQQLGDEAVPSELFQLHDEGMWFHFQDATHELHALLKRAERAHLLRIRTFLALRKLADDQAEIYRQMGWTLLEVEDEIEAELSVFRCDECERCFETAASLAVHQQRRHQQRVAVRRVTTDGVCRSCCKTFHTRPRLIHHLQHGLTRCWIFHLRKFKPMTIEQTNDKDENDRIEGTVLHRQGFQHVEKDQLWRWAEEWELQPHLPVLLDDSITDDDPTEAELAAWAQLGMLPAGQGGRSKTIRGQVDLQLYNVAFETNRLEKKLHDQVGKWQKGSSWVPKPLADGRKFLLVLFSGHRRDFDVAQFTSWTSDLIPISIDLAIDRECGNILHDGMWRDLIRSRQVSGAHGAPPCETFSLARWIEADGVAPRPLRNMEQPWGVDHRNLREVEQVTIGNMLMVKTLYLLTMVFFFGGSVTMEHPAEIEDKAHKWTIWDSAFVHQLLTIVGFYKVRFLQGPLGRPFSKPTNLLVGRIQNMHQIIYSKYDPMWRPTEKLGGRHNGAWRTTWAKEYPPKLCQALAEGHVNHSRIVPTSGDESDPPGLQRFLDCLAKTYDPYSGDLEGTVMKSGCDRSAAFAISRPPNAVK